MPTIAETDFPARPTQVGGNALPDGVMMRAGANIAIAVRRPDGSIATRAYPQAVKPSRMLRIPLLRGVVALRVAATTGRRAFMDAAELRMPQSETEEDRPLSVLEKLLIVVTAGVGLVLEWGILKLGPLFIAKALDPGKTAFVFIEGGIRIGGLILLLYILSRVPRIKKLLFGYHGAEHKTIATYEADEPLDADHAVNHSRFHPRCGTSFLLLSGFVSIAVFGVVLLVTGVFSLIGLIITRILFAPVVTAVTYEIQKFGAERLDNPFVSWLTKPGLAAQRITTAEPTHEQVEVAVESLRVALEPALATVRDAPLAAEPHPIAA
jgi:uncharacterized protein YqhQ